MNKKKFLDKSSHNAQLVDALITLARELERQKKINKYAQKQAKPSNVVSQTNDSELTPTDLPEDKLALLEADLLTEKFSVGFLDKKHKLKKGSTNNVRARLIKEKKLAPKRKKNKKDSPPNVQNLNH